MPRTNTSSKTVEALIGAACARNTSAELQYEHRNGGIITAHVRLVSLTQDQVLADKPVCLCDDGAIPTGAPITVHIMLRGYRYQFDSMIEEDNRRVPLNARQTVPGIALRKPDTIVESQRRAYLRVSMVGYDPINVYLAHPHPHIPDTCSIDAKIITGCLLDLSVGGILVLVDQQILRSVKSGERFFTAFALPGDAGEFNLLASVRHSSIVANKQSLRLGLSFHPWRGQEFKYDQRRISRYVAEHQRRMLRRRR